MSDAELRSRTTDLIRAAENISLELVLQTERLAATIDTYNREVVEPLRRGPRPRTNHD